MRIIAGKFKGRQIYTVPGLTIRPTSDRVREALFSILRDEIEGRIVIDLFAGSGALGLEAISRGARKAVFIDNNISAISVIKKNIRKLGLKGSMASIYRLDLLAKFKKLASTPLLFDIIFIDPPYALLPSLIPLFHFLVEWEKWNRGGIMVIEHSVKDMLPASFLDKAICFKEKEYGETILSLYRKR